MTSMHKLIMLLLLAIACFSTWKVDAWRYGKQLADVREEFADYKTGIATAATKASEEARVLEQQRQRDIDPAIRLLAGDLPGVAVGHDLVGLAPIRVAHEPDRHQRVLERAALVAALHAQVALGVAGHFARTHLPHGIVHLLAVEFGGLAQVDLVALHGPAAHEFGRVGLEVGGGRERLDLAQQPGVHAHGAGHQRVVEEVRELPGRGLPAHMADLARLRVAVGVAVGFGGVVVEAGVGLPGGLHMGVESPVGQVQALGVGF